MAGRGGRVAPEAERAPAAAPGSPAASARERAYLHIQRKIASGELRTGSALSELALAQQLGSSRTPVREALGQLAAEGLLQQTPNRGAVVVQLSRQDIVELYELREALEVYAVSKAARAGTHGPDLDRAQRLAGEMRELGRELEASGEPALNPEQMQRFMNQDLGFHALLMRMGANARMLKVVNETRLLIRIFAMRHRGHAAAELERIYQQHARILKAIAKGDAAAAATLLGQHIQSSRRERLEELDFWDRERSLQASVPALFAASGHD